MEVEKKRPKGGFLNLFDWNGKSRKKLFSSNSDTSGSRQGKENAESSSKPGLDRVEVGENATSSSNKGNDWNCASSVTSDEGYGTRAPCVVARLMGLESLPAPTVLEPSSTFGSHSHRALPNDDWSTSNLWSDFYATEYINMPHKLDKFSWNRVESRTEEMQNSLIARFQTEALPPKSAKSVPITHHKLLSPIKSPGFIPTNNAAYIMDAASRIIAASPRASAKSKLSAIGPSSIPLRIRDLKEKMEAVHKASRPERPKEGIAVKFMKGVPGDRSHSGSDNVQVPKASSGSERQHKDTRNKGKPVSLAEQAKVNVQRREGSTSFSNRSSMNQKEQNEAKRNQKPKSRLIAQRPPYNRTSADSSKSVLTQNNQKQNCVSNKDKMTSKSITPSQPTRRLRSTIGSNRPNKTASKVIVNSESGSGKICSMENSSGKEFSLSTMKNVSRKRRSASDDVHSKETVSDRFISEGERSIKCNVSVDNCTNLGTNNRKQDMDVVSFTFTSPLKRSISEMQSYGQVRSINSSFYIDSFGDNNQQSNPENFTLSSPGISLIGGDALSVLLEQKLQELSGKVESSQRNLSGEVTSASASSFSSLPDMVSSVASTTSRGKRLELGLHRQKLDSIDDYDCLSVDVNQQWQGSAGTEECSSNSSINCATREEFDYQHLRPASALEPSFESQSCIDNRSSATGSNSDICSLARAENQSNLFSPNEILPPYGVSDLFDSASSASTSDASGNNMSRVSGSQYLNGTNSWELEYVRYILSNVDLTMENFALGDAHNVITPSLFDHLESQEEEYPKLQRKALFDCVNESLQFRCKQHFGGSRRAWDRWATLSRRKGWLAEELYKDISGWKNTEELMVDQLVDKDMSSLRGRWLEFEIEAFEEGLEIEKEVLSSLVDELVSDFWHF